MNKSVENGKGSYCRVTETNELNTSNVTITELDVTCKKVTTSIFQDENDINDYTEIDNVFFVSLDKIATTQVEENTQLHFNNDTTTDSEQSTDTNKR
ncbi:hypothetical protein Btru_043136 [Bulinus truncatus]|nr:hypothetical protein Btru_043136 [Bulinus truncatus]